MRPAIESAEVVVVGGGAIGACVAYSLAADGHTVLLLERGEIGMGASCGTACLVTASHAERLASPASLRNGLRSLPDPAGPLSIRPAPRLLPWLTRFVAASLRRRDADRGNSLLLRLAVESTEAHRTLARELGTGLVEAGLLNCYVTNAGIEARDALAAEHRAAGLDVRLLDREELRHFEPSVRAACGAAFYPSEAHVDSLGFVRRVAEGARRAGARLATGVEALRLVRRQTELRIETTAGAVAARTVVLAAGVWSRRFAGDLGLSLPLAPAKGYHLEYAGVAEAPRRPVFLIEPRVVATPLEGRLRLAGTFELGSDPEAVNHRRLAAVARAGAAHIAGVGGARVTSVWRGLRPLSADGMPIVGRAPADERVLLAVGHGTLGITLGPLTGVHVAALARGEELPAALAPLRPERFRRAPLSGRMSRYRAPVAARSEPQVSESTNPSG
jgi:D-amino-acid dehydrogenase